MGKILLEQMEFFAYHGCYEAEQIVGNHFMVNLEIETDLTKAASTDDLRQALNYVQAYEIVSAEMKIRSHLLEHLAQRILTALSSQFPEIQSARLKVSKLHPPIGGQMKAVSVEMSI